MTQEQLDQQVAQALTSGYVGGPVDPDPTVGWQPLYTVEECQTAIAIIEGWLLLPMDGWPFGETQAHRDARLQARITLLQAFIDDLNSQDG